MHLKYTAVFNWLQNNSYFKCSNLYFAMGLVEIESDIRIDSVHLS